MNCNNAFSTITFLFLFTLCGCTTNKTALVQWNYAKSEITGNTNATTDKLQVDIYVDVTTSMKGFTSGATTNYSRMLDDMEGICQNTWKNTDIRYYKFGRRVDSIGRNEFITAKTSPVIYSDPQLSTQTNFAGAVAKTDAKRVSILITDFFYNNNDVNLVSAAFKKCFSKGVDAGVAGFSSAFDGVVADVSPAVRVKGTRPVYVLIFGDRQNISLFFNILKNKPYVNANRFLLLTAKPTLDFTGEVVKDRTSRSLKNYATKEDLKKWGTVFTFRMDPKEKEGVLNATVKITPAPYIFPYGEKNIRAFAFKKSGGDKDSSSAGSEIKFSNANFANGSYKTNVLLSNNDKEGVYSYAVYLTLDNTVAPQMPAWIKEVSTDTYGQNLNEDKTLNLEKLLTDITTSQLTDVQPRIAKWYMNIEKK